MLATGIAISRADFGNFIPLLFVIYVIFAVFSAMSKAIKNAAQAQKAASAAQPTSDEPQMTASDVRLALQRRLAAAAAARAQAASPQAPRGTPALAASTATVVAGSAASALPDLSLPGDSLQVQSLADTSVMSPVQSGPSLATMLSRLPPAAQAIVAGVVIGPCAAHRGGGHAPEDW